MKYLLIVLLLVSTLFLMTACTVVTPKNPALHDFGPPVSISAAGNGKQGNRSMISVDAPTWLWDNRIRYRPLYASPTRVGFYALDLWAAPPPELFEQLLMSGGRTQNYALIIRLQDFEQQFDAPGRSRVVLRFFAEAYDGDTHKKTGTREFYLERPAMTPDAAGAVDALVHLTRRAVDDIQGWLAKLSNK
jgi:cholesterol transport system auxiliary component